jgi:LacI family transcriptional regulator
MAPRDRVTIVDVASAAGVTPSTVSKALNDAKGSAAVRRRVEEAAARLGYRPNARAQSLRRARSHALGVLVPDLANPVFVALLRGVERVARERGYVVLVADAQRSGDVATAALQRFFDQGVDGIVLGGPVPAEALDLYLAHGVPIAPAVSESERDVARHWERGEAAATRAMAQRLVALGHRRFAFVSTPAPEGPSGRRYRRGRLGTFARVVRDAGGTLTGATVEPASDAGARRDLLLAAVTDGDPTAVVCATHLVAPWVLEVLRDAERRVPVDVSVVVYGDSDWARAYDPALSVVRFDTGAEGERLAASLLDRIDDGAPVDDGGEVDGPAPVAAVSEWVERASIAPARR